MLISIENISYLGESYLGYCLQALATWFPSQRGAASRDDGLEDRRPRSVTTGLITDIIANRQSAFGLLALALGLGTALAIGPRTLRARSSRHAVSTASNRTTTGGVSSSRPDGPPPSCLYAGLVVRVLKRGLFGWTLPRMYDYVMNVAGGMFGSSGIFGSGRKGKSGDPSQQQEDQLAKNRQKLKDYHALAREAVERAFTADQQGRYDGAVRLYGTALEAVREGLRLQVVPSNGLGPKADSVAGWRSELQDWEGRLAARLQAINSGHAASTSAPPVRPVPYTAAAMQRQHSHAAPAPPPLRQQQQPSPLRPGSAAAAAAAAGAQRPASVGRTRPPLAAAGPASKSVVLQRPSKPGGTAAAATRPGGAAAAGGRNAEDGLAKYREIVTGEILDRSPAVRWDDVAGLATAKAALTEAVILPALRPDLFQGLRAPVRGILLYGPPGNGKTMLAKALAAQSQATFFNISASSLTSKWVGDGEKLVRALFEVASERQPSIIFMDELDSLLGARGKAGESDASRRLLTEFLVQADGVGGAGRERVVVVGATNRPQELDDAVRRRLTKRIYIPLPDAEGRRAVLSHLLRGQYLRLTDRELLGLVESTRGYSASDLAALCKEAAMAPLRELAPERLASVAASALRPMDRRDFEAAMRVVRPSVDAASLRAYEDFTKAYGTQ